MERMLTFPTEPIFENDFFDSLAVMVKKGNGKFGWKIGLFCSSDKMKIINANLAIRF